MSRRITPESFIAAVKRTGTVPKRCLWVRERSGRNGKPAVTEVCAIGALCVDAGAHKHQSARAWAMSKDGLGLDSKYIYGFITGFDGYKPRAQWDDLGIEHDGYADGLACAYAAFEEKLHEEYRVSWADDPSPWMEPTDVETSEQYVWCRT